MKKYRRAFIRRLAATGAGLIGAGRSSMGYGNPTPAQAVTPRRSPSIPPAPPARIPAPGTFAEFTTNVPTDLAPPSDPWIKKAILSNWCGGTFVDDFGAMGAAVYEGGGEHYSWSDRGGILVLDCAARAYTMRCVPKIKTHMGVAGILGSDVNDYGEYADDGYPQAKHTYNGLAPFPRDWGGGPQGGLMVIQSGGPLKQDVPWYIDEAGTQRFRGAGWAAAHAYDLSKSHDGHTRISGEQKLDLGSGRGCVVYDAPGIGIDWTRQGWWVFGRTGAGHGDRMAFVHKSGRIDPPGTPPIALAWGRLHHFDDDDTLCAVAGGAPTSVVIINLSAARPQWTGVTLTGNGPDLALFNTRYGGYIGFQWCSILNCLVGIHAWPLSGDTSRVGVWKIIPPDTAPKRWSQPWALELEVLTSADGSVIDMANDHAVNAGNGTSYGKLVECKALRSLVWTRRIDRRGQLLRLRGM